MSVDDQNQQPHSGGRIPPDETPAGLGAHKSSPVPGPGEIPPPDLADTLQTLVTNRSAQIRSLRDQLKQDEAAAAQAAKDLHATRQQIEILEREKAGARAALTAMYTYNPEER